MAKVPKKIKEKVKILKILLKNHKENKNVFR